MPSVVSQGTYVRLFADDCLAYRPIHSDQYQIILQQDPTALQNWAERWGKRFNPPKNVILCIFIILRYDPGCTSYAVKYCIAFPRPNILESLSPTTYHGMNGSVKWQQKRIPDSILYLETWSIAPDIWGRLPTAPSHVQAWSIAPVSGILICRRIKSNWINHLPPACWSTFWKSIFKQQLGCRCDIMDSISYLFFLYFDWCNYICLDTSYHFLDLSLLLKYSLIFQVLLI